MSNLTQALQTIGEAIEDARRAFGKLVTEIEILDNASKQNRRDIEDGLKREAELREILRDRGLASYNDDDPGRRPNDDSRNS